MRRLRSLVPIGVAVIVAALVLAACSSSTTPSGSAGSSGGTKQAGGTATYAEAPNAIPNYIFPFMSLAFFSVYNINQFQFLMYRPLYWFGNGAQPTLNPALSLAQNPVYSNNNTTVVVNLKPYKWSNGETVTAQDVMFWMNMMHSDKANWAAYAPGFIPDNVKSLSVDSPTQLTFTLTASVNPYWFTYNQLSQITPLPVAWDITSTGATAGSGGCSAAAFGTPTRSAMPSTRSCRSRPGTTPPTRTPPTTPWPRTPRTRYGRSWTGPGSCPRSTRRATSASSPTRATRARRSPPWRSSWSCPSPPTTPSSTPWWADTSNFGYLPLQDVTKPTTNPLVPAGNNPRLIELHPGAAVHVVGQLLPGELQLHRGRRQRRGHLEAAVHPPGVPVPGRPAAVHQQDRQGLRGADLRPGSRRAAEPVRLELEKSNPYPYNLTKAKSLLTSHGWNVVPNGTTTCTSPGTGANQCGAGIPSGAKLDFNLRVSPAGTRRRSSS